MKQLVLASILFLGLSGSAKADYFEEQVIDTGAEILGSFNPLEELAQEFWFNPDWDGYIVEICADYGGPKECVTVDKINRDLREKGGSRETIEVKGGWTRDVADVVRSATGGVSGEANVKVGVKREETKPDGSKTSTTVNVEVTVKAKKK